MDDFFMAAEYIDNPLSALNDFLSQEAAYEAAGSYGQMRFVGYVLDIGFDSARIITSDPYKNAVGGIPRGSFLIMAPSNHDGMPPHFSLLRVEDVAPTPLGAQVQQTYFELHKKSMPELDVWTQSELQWGALNTKVLGMFYPSPEDSSKMSFSGDVNSVVSAHRYRVYSPNEALLNLIVNGTVNPSKQVQIGFFRATECQLPFANIKQPVVPVKISVKDFLGFRTAMFGKTRLGKSNVVKIIAQSVIEATKSDEKVGQLIFDINGEYANDNPQDNNLSLRSVNADRCEVYSIVPRPKTPSHPLKLNFYERPSAILPIIARLLDQANQNAQYVRSFAAVQLPDLDSIPSMQINDKIRAIRKIQMFWALLHKAGFSANEPRLKRIQLHAGANTRDFNPGFNQPLRDAAWGGSAPVAPDSLATLLHELEKIIDFIRANSSSPLLLSGSHNLFDADDMALLEFLKPRSGGGPVVLRPFIQYHDPNAGDIVVDIIRYLDDGKTVILDLGNANDQIRRYFSDLLSKGVFTHQEDKFVSNTLEDHFIQLYFEEAHNLFPRDSKEITDVYSRFAKEGAKFHIGMVYSTQSPSSVSQELLMQSENFFVGHLASIDEAKTLSRQQAAFNGIEVDILRSRTPGYMRMLTFSHRFVVPVQAFLYEAKNTKPIELSAE
jgi:hypothetical protein